APDGKLVVVVRLANYTQHAIDLQLDIAGVLNVRRNAPGTFRSGEFEAPGGGSFRPRRSELAPGAILRGELRFDAPVDAYFLQIYAPSSSKSRQFGCSLERM